MKNKNFKKRIKQNGFTLVELMVAVGIGTFMLGVMAKVLIDMKKTSVTQMNIQKIQNDITFPLEKIRNKIAQFELAFRKIYFIRDRQIYCF